MAEPTAAEILELKVVFKDREIFDVEVLSGDGMKTPFTAADRKKFKRSKYGLRPLETLSEYDPEPESLVARRCFMVIGGFKVEVPCG